MVSLTQMVLLLGCVTAHKNILDFDDGDIEKLYRQWEENDEEVEHPENSGSINGAMLNSEKFDPEQLLKESKKGKPVMMFIGVQGTPDQDYTEKISSRWMQSLQNAHIQLQRYVVAPDRVLFVVQDGSLAWDVKDYLVTLKECTTVSFDQLSFDCNKKDEL